MRRPPDLQDTALHAPASQAAVATLGSIVAQSLLQAPQWDTVILRSVSQPLLWSVSQWPQPASHNNKAALHRQLVCHPLLSERSSAAVCRPVQVQPWQLHKLTCPAGFNLACASNASGRGNVGQLGAVVVAGATVGDGRLEVSLTKVGLSAHTVPPVCSTHQPRSRHPLAAAGLSDAVHARVH